MINSLKLLYCIIVSVNKMPCVKYDDDEPPINSDAESIAESEVLYIYDYYPTKTARKIVNAFTGAVYPYTQGSHDELRLYKFVDARGFYDDKGCRLTRFDPVNRTPNFLYYDSPEQCARHLHIKMMPERVKKWYSEKNRLFSVNGDFNKDEWTKLKKETYNRMNRLSV